MNEAALKKRLAELSEALSLPAFPTAEAGKDGSGEYVGTTLTSVEETLDFMRLQVKYLIFDLEATKRENGYLRRMLETRRHPNDETEDNPPKW